MKLFSLFTIIFSVFLLSACEDTLNKLSADELMQEAEGHYKGKDWKEAVRFWENFELRFPSHPKVAEAMYQRGLAYYNAGSYAQAVAVFEAFIDKYPLHEKKIDAQAKMFYCFYNQITRYDRDYSLLEKAVEYGQAYAKVVYEDKQFEDAMKRLHNFVVHYSLQYVHLSLDSVPKLWIQLLWKSNDIINNYPEHPEAAEAYYRVIEFLCAQKNDGMLQDAKGLLVKMQQNHANTEWYMLAKKCVGDEKIHQGESTIVEIGIDSEGVEKKSKNN